MTIRRYEIDIDSRSLKSVLMYLNSVNNGVVKIDGSYLAQREPKMRSRNFLRLAITRVKNQMCGGILGKVRNSPTSSVNRDNFDPKRGRIKHESVVNVYKGIKVQVVYVIRYRVRTDATRKYGRAASNKKIMRYQ